MMGNATCFSLGFLRYIITMPAPHAAAPFDHAQADIILRSSDSVDFRIFKHFLSLASPFFETLFTLPQPTDPSVDQEIKDGLVVVPVTEDSKTLDALLRYCYPCTLADDPCLEVFEDALNVLHAARKYSFDVIEKKVTHAFSNPKILETEPLRCFALAHGKHMHEEALLAAKYTLMQPLIPSWFDEIGLLTAATLLALLTYHRECGDAAYALRTDVSWIRSHYGSSQGCAWLSGKYAIGPTGFHGANTAYRECTCPRSFTPKYRLFETYSLQWWEDFMDEMFAALREKPCGETVARLAPEIVQSVRNQNCPTCSAKIAEGIRDFSDLLAKKVEDAVSRIKLDFSEPRGGNILSSYLSISGQGSSKEGKKRR